MKVLSIPTNFGLLSQQIWKSPVLGNLVDLECQNNRSQLPPTTKFNNWFIDVNHLLVVKNVCNETKIALWNCNCGHINNCWLAEIFPHSIVQTYYKMYLKFWMLCRNYLWKLQIILQINKTHQNINYVFIWNVFNSLCSAGLICCSL